MKKKMKKIVQWIVSVLSLIFIVHYFSKNELYLQLALRIKPSKAIIVMLLCACYLLLQGYYYKVCLDKCSEKNIGFGPWFKIFILGRFLSNFVPLSGNVYRSISLKRIHGVPYTHYIGSFFTFSWLDSCLSFLLALIVIWDVNSNLQVGPFRALHLIAFLVILFFCLPILSEKISPLITIRFQRLAWLQSKLGEVLRVSVRNLRDVRFMAGFSLAGLGVFLLACTMFYVCFSSIGIHVGAAELVFFYVFLKLSGYVSITPGNIGVQEILFGVISQQMQIGMAEGILASALLRVLSYVTLCCIAVPMGGLALVRERSAYVDSDNNNP